MSPPTQHILAFDVGNTRIKYGLLHSSTDTLPQCRRSAVVGRDEEIPWKSVSKGLEAVDLKSIQTVIAGSHPDRIRQLVDGWPVHKLAKPHLIENASGIPLNVNLPKPEQVGIDRLLNAVAANRLRSDDRPVIIVDCGTATTVDVVSTSGAFEGGAILPGLELSSRALHHYTARLPLVDVAELAQSTPQPLGRNTQEAIQSGLYWGQVGAVRELVLRLSEKLTNPQILLTGGGGQALTPYVENARYNPQLSLQGLALIMQSRS